MSEKSGSRGPGFISLLTLLFIALKLTGVINWAWVWVLSPMWLAFGLFLVLAIIAVVLK